MKLTQPYVTRSGYEIYGWVPFKRQYLVRIRSRKECKSFRLHLWLAVERDGKI